MILLNFILGILLFAMDNKAVIPFIIIFFIAFFILKFRKNKKENVKTDDIETNEIPKVQSVNNIDKSKKQKPKMTQHELEMFMIQCNSYLKHKDEVEEYERMYTRTNDVKAKGISDKELERFARVCNAQLEHEDEMTRYKERFGIKDKE